MVSGRVYVMGQVLAREHERNTALQQQLQQQTDEVEHLRTEVEQLRQREADLRAALDRATASATPGTASSIGSGVSASEPTSDGRADAAEARRHETEAVAAAAQARRELEQQHAVVLARLQTTLEQEQHRRQEVEAELSRLKEETSSPPYGQGQAGEAELASAKQQVAELRTALDNERAARERLTMDFRALQERAAAETAGSQSPSADTAALRTRLQQLQDEKESITQSFNRSLAESQQRAAALEQQLAKNTTDNPTVSSDGDLTNIRAENAALRARLDDEHRRTEELAAKLKVATRVTDLIFKMQGQQAAEPVRR